MQTNGIIIYTQSTITIKTSMMMHIPFLHFIPIQQSKNELLQEETVTKRVSPLDYTKNQYND
jgi:hypothetical protein